MKVWFKRVVVSLVVVFLVALVSIAIFLLTFDPNAYKSKLADLVYERYQRSLTIKGDIKLSLFPRIGLSVQGVALSDRNSTDTFASLDSARFAVAIWPLMFNRFVVDHVAVTGFKAWLERDEKGEFNFQDLIERQSLGSSLAAPLAMVQVPATASSTPWARQLPAVLAAPASTGADFQIDIAGLDLKSGEIHLYDRPSKSVGRIVQLDVNTGRMTFDQAFDVSFKGKLIGDFPVADASLQGQALVKVDPQQHIYSAQKLNVQVNGKLGNLDARSATLRGNLAYSAYSETLDASSVEFAVQGQVEGERPIKNLDMSLVVPQLKVDRGQAELRVDQLIYRATGERQDQRFDIAFDAPGLSVSPEAAKGQPITGTVKLTSKNEVLGLSLGMSGLGGNSRKLTLKELKIDGGLKQGDRFVQLKMTTPANWDRLADKGDLSAMKGDVRIEDAALPGGSFEFPFIGSLQTDLIKDELTSEINAVLSSSKLDFRVKATRLNDPQVVFDLTADRLDFNTLFPPAAPAPAPTPAPAARDGKPVAPPPPAAKADAKPPTAAAPVRAGTLDLAFLDAVDVAGNIAIGDLKIKNVQAQEFNAGLRAVDGLLAVTGLRANLYDGKLSGKISADSKNKFATDLTLDNVALGTLLRDLADETRLGGRGTVKLKLDSQGSTIPALRAGLNGLVQVKVRDGAVRGLDVGQTLREVRSVVRNVFSGQLPILATEFDLGRQTDFTTLDADVAFTNGQGIFKKLNVVAPPLRITQGTPASMDIVNEQLDLNINVQVANGSVSEFSKELIDLKGTTVPVRISGPFDKLGYQVQWKEIGSKAVKDAVQDGLLDLLSNQLSQQQGGAPAPAGPIPAPPKKPMDPVKSIGDALKGLLGQ
jgi:AsmA protein